MNSKYKILIVEDDHYLALNLRKTIQTSIACCECVVANSLKMAEVSLVDNEFELVILDRNLPDGDGLKIIEDTVGDLVQVKYLVLSSLGDVREREIGLLVGAHDYLPKPFSKVELIQRVKNLLKMKIKIESKLVCYDHNFRFCAENKSLEVDGKKTPLTITDCKLLAYFIENKNLLISRDRLIDLIWYESRKLSENAINAQIYRLRKKMGRFGNLLRASYNYGYQLNMTNKLMMVMRIT